ncbi:hypothetical protein PR202_gb12074 [Eleusine coracana subsp. coracana]|uniref:F-box protein AT5G49610-like beta-propeller domain-containing protein n=1 Tax=Eleusine coracana subsp. coracana TaxID=191504 RepID=A0AAV5EPJ4_ELECO|nr:hypothetical protein QOZ80_7BG0584610 [Eleusine coracana subsp. coracana]GJN24337.1 hypothetical protein PR202_gb12074 [Eleusine coracana subsp. coracana]
MAAPPSSRHVVPALVDDLVEAILLRLPPDDPASLLRAAQVGKSWRRLVSGAGFRRRFRDYHGRTPPMLGFLCSFGHAAGPLYYGEGDARFMSTATSLRRLPRGAAVGPRWRAVDALHGRILFYDRDLVTARTRALDFFVLSPMITGGEVWRLPSLVPHRLHGWSAGLLCNSDHDDDDNCPLRVVVVSTNPSTRTAYVYSSEQHAWTIQSSVQHNHVLSIMRLSSGRIGNNALYFRCDSPQFCVEYHMSTQQLSVINLPSEWAYKWTNFMTAENGGLGLAMLDGYNLYTMSSKRTDGVDGQVFTWESSRVISLSKLLPDVTDVTTMHVAAVVDVLGVILIRTKIGLFSIDIKSSKVKKLWDGNVGCYVGDIVPYVSFCTPATCQVLP